MKRRLLPPNVTSFLDRHRRERLRFRRKGQKTYYFKSPFGTEEFRVELRACLDSQPTPIGLDRVAPGSFNDLIGRYYRSTSWNKKSRSEGTKLHDKRIIERFRAKHGQRLVAEMEYQDVDTILAGMSETPTAANKLRKQLRRLCAFAVKVGMRTDNPVDHVDTLETDSKGFHTWTEPEIEQFQNRHPLGTKARLAMELMLWTGQRKSDIVRMGRQHISDGRISLVQQKTKKPLRIPVAPRLLEAIVAMPNSGQLAFLVTEYGRPFTANGFGNWFRARCDEAGLPHCSSHGLRKAISRRMAEIGASNQTIKSVTGHSGDSEVALYTKDADQQRMADVAIARLAEWELANRAEKLANDTKEAVDNAQ